MPIIGLLSIFPQFRDYKINGKLYSQSMKKLLVTSETLCIDSTSEGICTSKFILALHRAGYQVYCLTSDAHLTGKVGEFTLPWLGDVPIKHIFDGNQPEQKLRRKSSTIENKLQAAVAHLTGWNTMTWRSVGQWRKALRKCISEVKPDIIFVRSAGMNFHPHLAISSMKMDIPWVAHYHDPFPISLYPEPYRRVTPILCANQERYNNQILTQANALTFPSERLKNWMVGSKSEKIKSKAYVLPHLGSDLCNEIDNSLHTFGVRGDEFNLVHLGNVLGHRNPNLLIEAYKSFLWKSEERRKKSKLFMVGPVSNKFVANDLWNIMINQGNLVNIARRISYSESLAIGRMASVLVLIEANNIESPFFPGKLADYIWLRKPILALTPKQSSTTDILGADYPLLTPPNNVDAIEGALTIAWEHWISDTSNSLLPSQNTLEGISEASVIKNVEQIIQAVSSTLQHDSC